ncbi:hypothetical protein D3C78_1249920 [compost metagenome]
MHQASRGTPERRVHPRAVAVAAGHDQVDRQPVRLVEDHQRRIALDHAHGTDQLGILARLPQFIAEAFHHALLDAVHDIAQPAGAQLSQGLLVQIGFQYRLGEQPERFNGMHHIQLGVIGASQGQGMLENVRGIEAKVGGVKNRMDHAAS